MLTPENTLLIVIDVQGNLARVVAGSESAIQAVARLVRGMGLLEIPVLLTAQVPEKIGHTIPEIASLLPNQEDLSRVHFSIWQDEGVQKAIRSSGRRPPSNRWQLPSDTTQPRRPAPNWLNRLAR